jgi:thioesterase domain-containing protein
MPPQTLDEIVATYVRQIKSVQPVGPYQLIGWSFGGTVAHAIAVELQNNNDRVALLSLLDSAPFEYDLERFKSIDSDGLLRSVLGQLAGSAAACAQSPLSVASVAALLKKTNGLLGEIDEHRISALVRTYMRNLSLKPARAVGRFDGDLLYFRATESETAIHDDAWRSLVGGEIDIRDVAATHHDMAQPRPISQIAHTLTESLDRIYREAGGAG